MRISRLLTGHDPYYSRSISLMPVEHLIQLFYGFKLILLTWYISDFLKSRNTDEALWLWPVSWLSRIDNPMNFLLPFFVVVIALLLLSLFKPWNIWIKSCEALSAFLFLAIYFSFGKIDHSFYSFLLSSLFIALITQQNEEKDILNSRNRLALQSASAIFLFLYGLSGLWKLRFLLSEIFQSMSLTPLFGTLSFQVAKNMMESGSDNPLSLWLIQTAPGVQAICWLLIIAFEFLCFFVIFRPSLYRIWGILLILFHFFTDLFLDISFEEAQLLAVILLIGFPIRPKVEQGF